MPDAQAKKTSCLLGVVSTPPTWPNFEQFHSNSAFWTVLALNRCADTKCGRKRSARALRVVIHGLCCFKMSSNLSRRVVVAASQPSVRSRFVGLVQSPCLIACGVARGGQKISIRSVCDGWCRLFFPNAFRLYLSRDKLSRFLVLQMWPHPQILTQASSFCCTSIPYYTREVFRRVSSDCVSASC